MEDVLEVYQRRTIRSPRCVCLSMWKVNEVTPRYLKCALFETETL
jgi:hypothetical protein